MPLMENFSSLASSIKEKLNSPRNTLLNMPNLEFPLEISRNSIVSISKIAKYLFVLNTPEPVYISIAFNTEFDFESIKYEKIIFRKCYDSIFYDFQTE